MAGTAKQCIVTDHLEQNLQDAKIDEHVIKDVAAVAYAGESNPSICRMLETTALSIISRRN